MGPPLHCYACEGQVSGQQGWIVRVRGILGRQQESPCDVMMTWLRLKSPVKCIPHPYDNDTYTKCFSFFICWGFTCGSHPYSDTSLQVWGGFLRLWG
jgi:hypothetical protein